MTSFIFDYATTVEECEKVQLYICEKYIEGVDFEMHIGYGDDIMNAFDIMNVEMLNDAKMNELLGECKMFEE